MTSLDSRDSDGLILGLNAINGIGRAEPNRLLRAGWRALKCAQLDQLIVSFPEEVLAIQDNPARPEIVSVRFQRGAWHVPLHHLTANARSLVVPYCGKKYFIAS